MAKDEMLASALDSIDPCGLEYSEFIEIGMALKSAGEDFSLWDEWASRDSKRYKGTLRTKWDGFADSNAAAPVKGGTVIQLARDRGWEPQRPDEGEGHALSWDMTEIDAEPKKGLIDPTWVEGEEIAAPASDWEGWRDLVAYLDAVFEPGEVVGYVTESWRDEKTGRFLPSGQGPHGETAGDIKKRVTKHKGELDASIGFNDHGGGAWIRFNPLDGQGVRNSNVSEFRHALVESDTVPKDKQLAIIKELRLPVSALVDSGNKSIHAIVRVDAKDYGEYRQRVDELYKVCRENGLPVDTQNKNPSRLSRMPGVTRGGAKQWLMGTNIGCESWAEWKEWYAEQTDDLPEPESLADVWDAMPELAPPLIDGVLRLGHKMLLAGPSKAGKSFALIELCIAIAEGGRWMGFPVATRGKVLYVNLELDRASCLHRFRDVYAATGTVPSHVGDIEVWNLRGKGKPLDQLAPSLIRRAVKMRPVAVVIDPIYKVITGDENSAEQMARFCVAFDQIADSVGCSVIYCHHHSKGAQGGKASMDRASGSGVFARDPDALLDMIELHIPKAEAEKAEAAAVAGAICAYMDARPDMGGWRSLVSEGMEKEPAKLLEMVRTVFSNAPGLVDDLNGAVGAATDAARQRSAWRIDGTIREFPKFDPVNVWFSWPVHTVDGSGLLGGLFAEGDNSPEAVKSAREKGREAAKAKAESRQEERVEAMRDAIEECRRRGIPPTRECVRELCEDYLDEEISKKAFEHWTLKGTKWSPIKVRRDNGDWVLYDTEEEAMMHGW